MAVLWTKLPGAFSPHWDLDHLDMKTLYEDVLPPEAAGVLLILEDCLPGTFMEGFLARLAKSAAAWTWKLPLQRSHVLLHSECVKIENLLKILYSYNHCRHSGVSRGSLNCLNCLAWVANTWTDLTLGSPSACNSLLGWGAGSIFLFPETFRTWWTAGWGNISTLRHKVSRVFCRIKGQLHDFSDKMNFPNSVSPHKQL